MVSKRKLPIQYGGSQWHQRSLYSVPLDARLPLLLPCHCRHDDVIRADVQSGLWNHTWTRLVSRTYYLYRWIAYLIGPICVTGQ